jgi:hypothetical protein
MNNVCITLKIDLLALIVKLNNANPATKFLIIKDSLVSNLNFFNRVKNVDIVNCQFVKMMNVK